MGALAHLFGHQSVWCRSLGRGRLYLGIVLAFGLAGCGPTMPVVSTYELSPLATSTPATEENVFATSSDPFVVDDSVVLSAALQLSVTIPALPSPTIVATVPCHATPS